MELNKTQKGDMISFTNFAKIVSVDKNGNSITVEDTNGDVFDIQGKDLIQKADSAGQFAKQEKVNKKEMAETLLNARDSVFTVHFEKADGNMRTLVGRLLESENLMGRSNVIDLELPSHEKNKMRQVDHRTIEWMILRGIKYTTK